MLVSMWLIKAVCDPSFTTSPGMNNWKQGPQKAMFFYMKHMSWAASVSLDIANSNFWWKKIHSSVLCTLLQDLIMGVDNNVMKTIFLNLHHEWVLNCGNI